MFELCIDGLEDAGEVMNVLVQGVGRLRWDAEATADVDQQYLVPGKFT